MDTRPTERVQHSWLYGKMILKIYGYEAYLKWNRKVSLLYFNQERRIHPYLETKEGAELSKDW